MKTVLTSGTFDVPHMGHAIFLYRAASLGDRLVVNLNSDEYALTQGKKTIYPFKERYNLLYQLPCVDEVLKNDVAEMRVIIEKIKPDILVIGSDWGDRYFKQINCSPVWLAQHRCTLIYLPYTQEISTTDIKKRCK